MYEYLALCPNLADVLIQVHRLWSLQMKIDQSHGPVNSEKLIVITQATLENLDTGSS